MLLSVHPSIRFSSLRYCRACFTLRHSWDHDPGSILYTFPHDVPPSSWWSFHCHCQCRSHHCYC